MWKFQQKMKRIFSTLSHWSRAEYGDINANVKAYEQKIQVVEENLILNEIDENEQVFHRIQAEYIRHRKVEEVVLKQRFNCTCSNIQMLILVTFIL